MSANLCSICGHQPAEFVCEEADNNCREKLFCDDCELNWHGQAGRRGHCVRVHLPDRNQLLWNCPHCTFTNDEVLSDSSKQQQLRCAVCQADCAADVSIRGVWLTSQRATEALIGEAKLADELQSIVRDQEVRIAELTQRLEAAQRRLSSAAPARPNLLLHRSQSETAAAAAQPPLLSNRGGLRRSSAPTGASQRRCSGSAATGKADRSALVYEQLVDTACQRTARPSCAAACNSRPAVLACAECRGQLLCDTCDTDWHQQTEERRLHRR
uniref:RING-type domain-containing protein n=1 Tax=Macrostomum lignano TaxID=282301 RepID=A0A1I8IRN3_9PLAT